jgi:putative transposase
MTKITTKPDSLQPATELAVDLFDNWIDPIETEVRARAINSAGLIASNPAIA